MYVSTSPAKWQDDTRSKGIIDSKDKNMKQAFEIQVCS